MRIQDHFSISVNLDVGHGQRAGLCPPSDTVVYIISFLLCCCFREIVKSSLQCATEIINLID